jgi:CHRD domain
MKNLTVLFLLFSLSTLSATLSATDRVYNVRVNLNGANVVPANATTATGTLTSTFNDVSGVFNFTVAHNIPTPIANYRYTFNTGARGTNGGSFLTVNLPNNPFSYTNTFTNILDIMAGNTYVSFEGDAGIEIRGQIIIGIEVYNNAAQNAFYGIGGYSFTKEIFTPDSVQPTPYVLSGPSPQNDFSYAITANGGAISHSAGVWGYHYHQCQY